MAYTVREETDMKIPASKVPAQVWADKMRTEGDLSEAESERLRRWDSSKQVYRVNSTLWDELKIDNKDEIPVSVFSKLPYDCIFIERKDSFTVPLRCTATKPIEGSASDWPYRYIQRMGDMRKSRKEVICMAVKDIPIWEKYTLTIEEAARYFRIGEGKLRRLADEKPAPNWLIMNGNRVQIKRKKFESFIDSTDVI